MHFVKVVNMLTTTIEGRDTDTLMVVLPIVGISVVIGGLSLLAIILKQFIRLNPEARQAQKDEKTAAQSTTDKKDATSAPAAGDDDEIAAISAALYLFMSESGDPVNLTEIPQEYNVSPWVVCGRKFQGRRYDRWLSQKVR